MAAQCHQQLDSFLLLSCYYSIFCQYQTESSRTECDPPPAVRHRCVAPRADSGALCAGEISCGSAWSTVVEAPCRTSITVRTAAWAKTPRMSRLIKSPSVFYFPSFDHLLVGLLLSRCLSHRAAVGVADRLHVPGDSAGIVFSLFLGINTDAINPKCSFLCIGVSPPCVCSPCRVCTTCTTKARCTETSR